MLVDLIIFFIALGTFYFARPYAEYWAVKLISVFRIMKRISKISITDDARDIQMSKEDASIGLSSEGPIFSNTIFSFIAEKNKGLIDEMQRLILNAGIRHKGALEEFMKSKFIAGLALFFMIFLFLISNDTSIPFFASIIISFVIGAIGGHKLTNINLKMLSKRRRESIENGIPDLIDLLVICTESGLDLNGAIKRIARELRTSNPVLADELSLTAIELEMIPDHKQAFENLENRTNCMEIKTLSKTLSQSIEYGSSLTVSLRDLAVESRQKRMIKAETRAAQTPTLMTLPMMFFIMPCLFIVMLGPVIIGMMKSFNG